MDKSLWGGCIMRPPFFMICLMQLEHPAPARIGSSLPPPQGLAPPGETAFFVESKIYSGIAGAGRSSYNTGLASLR